MLPATLYELHIDATPKAVDPFGRQQPGSDYYVRLRWDDRIVLDAWAPSPEALGRIVGDAVRHMAESHEQQTR